MFLKELVLKTLVVLKSKNIDFKKKLLLLQQAVLEEKHNGLNKYPNHKIVSLRGNVESRIKKLEKNNWDGAIFAKAGLDRLSISLENKIDIRLDDSICSTRSCCYSIQIK